MKYTTVKVSGVIIAIGETTNIPGYIKTILEPLLPSDDELKTMSQKEQNTWVKKSNKLMIHICHLMNTHIPN